MPPVSVPVLIFADHVDIATLIGRCLTSAGFRPVVASDLRQAALVLQRERPEVAVLDLVMPGQSDAVVQWLRRESSRSPMSIVRVSARARHGAGPRGDMMSEVTVPKPFTPRQIVDAVRASFARRAARVQLGIGAPPPRPPAAASPPAALT